MQVDARIDGHGRELFVPPVRLLDVLRIFESERDGQPSLPAGRMRHRRVGASAGYWEPIAATT
jgi:hypothetical protein